MTGAWGAAQFVFSRVALRYRYWRLLLGLLVLSGELYAQSNRDKQEIESLIKGYYEGYLFGKSDLLMSVFDTAVGVMILPTTPNKPDTLIHFRDLLPRWVKRAQERPYNTEQLAMSGYDINALSFVGSDLAIVTVTIQFGQNRYTDVLSSYRRASGWKIVSKVFIDTTPKKK